jgi:predicted nucleotidyltransferase
MTDQIKNPNDLLSAITQWAPSQTELIALALVGSHARAAARPDSDIDLVLIARNPQHYLLSPDWVEQFGSTRLTTVEPYGKLTSIRAFYRNGLEVEFGITSEEWIALPLDAGTGRVIEDGLLILFERDACLTRALRSIGRD